MAPFQGAPNKATSSGSGFFAILCILEQQELLGIRERQPIEVAKQGSNDLKSSIERGKLAHLIVVDRDILTIPENKAAFT